MKGSDCVAWRRARERAAGTIVCSNVKGSVRGRGQWDEQSSNELLYTGKNRPPGSTCRYVVAVAPLCLMVTLI